MAPTDLANAKVAYRRTFRVGLNWKLDQRTTSSATTARRPRAHAKMHTLKDLEENLHQSLRRCSENADVITGIPAFQRTYRDLLDAPSFGTCAHTTRYGFRGFVTGSQTVNPLRPSWEHQAGTTVVPVIFRWVLSPYAELPGPLWCSIGFIPASLTETDMELVASARGRAGGIDYDVDKHGYGAYDYRRRIHHYAQRGRSEFPVLRARALPPGV